MFVFIKYQVIGTYRYILNKKGPQGVIIVLLYFLTF